MQATRSGSVEHAGAVVVGFVCGLLTAVSSRWDRCEVDVDCSAVNWVEDARKGYRPLGGDAVLFDSWCGEPIAWARVGETVIGHEWTSNGQVSITERLTPAEAIRRYGPIAQIVLGPQGGFKSVTYGTKKFICSFVDPRRTGLYDESIVVVDDPTRNNYECQICAAVPGAPCTNKKQQPCGTHAKRSQGRSRWDIERAELAAREAQEQAAAKAQWRRDMATPPVIGAVLKVKYWQKDVAHFTVVRTYANRAVKATAHNREDTFLARNEFTGDWHAICGQPTSARLPCRLFANDCRARHKTGLHLRDDQPWT